MLINQPHDDLSMAWITGWTFARLQTSSSRPVPDSHWVISGHIDYKKTGKTFSLEFLECNLYSPFLFFGPFSFFFFGSPSLVCYTLV